MHYVSKCAAFIVICFYSSALLQALSPLRKRVLAARANDVANYLISASIANYDAVWGLRNDIFDIYHYSSEKKYPDNASSEIHTFVQQIAREQGLKNCEKIKVKISPSEKCEFATFDGYIGLPLENAKLLDEALHKKNSAVTLTPAEQYTIDKSAIITRHECSHIKNNHALKNVAALPIIAAATQIAAHRCLPCLKKLIIRPRTGKEIIEVAAIAATFGMVQSEINAFMCLIHHRKQESLADKEAITHGTNNELKAFMRYFGEKQKEITAPQWQQKYYMPYVGTHPMPQQRVTMAQAELDKRSRT